ncbi:MAG TPA: type II toxin-antitoxin system PemK/MazF family toxin [Blastocatellia bacterium]|nr:type II toxin-antitoxin system PemK/MazF family toxin [Blastocatellia bacterium]
MQASRGEVWMIDLSPTQGHEQAGKRPALVVSIDQLNHGPAQLAIVLPITSRSRGIPTHVQIDPPDGGLKKQSFALFEAVRSISTDRLAKRIGAVSPAIMRAVEDRLRILLGL